MKKTPHLRAARSRKVWIDLDNSPHVPFFAPIIDELRSRGYTLFLTARNAFQVTELTKLFNLNCKSVGQHHGKNMINKLAGLCLRAAELLPAVLSERPDLALSHGSRSQLVVSTILGIPSVAISDYEFSTDWLFMRPSWLMIPQVVPESSFEFDPHRILKYPGIKEDVYVPRFNPDPSIRAALGLNAEDLVVTLRPPASEAHYRNPESDQLFDSAIDFLSRKPSTRMILLPRNDRQAASLRQSWPHLFAAGKIIIPQHVVDGLNLIWHSDLVISGGGTMNREAAALGVPVYSVFRGKIGAVDQYLAEDGRLQLLESKEDLITKLVLARRSDTGKPALAERPALRVIVDNIISIIEQRAPTRSAELDIKNTSAAVSS